MKTRIYAAAAVKGLMRWNETKHNSQHQTVECRGHSYLYFTGNIIIMIHTLSSQVAYKLIEMSSNIHYGILCQN